MDVHGSDLPASLICSLVIPCVTVSMPAVSALIAWVSLLGDISQCAPAGKALRILDVALQSQADRGLDSLNFLQYLVTFGFIQRPGEFMGEFLDRFLWLEFLRKHL